MKELVERIHLALGVVLLASLLLAWSWLRQPTDAVALGERIYLLVNEAPHPSSDPAFVTLQASLALLRKDDTDLRGAIGHTSISSVLLLRRLNVFLTFADTGPSMSLDPAQREKLHAAANALALITDQQVLDSVGPSLARAILPDRGRLFVASVDSLQQLVLTTGISEQATLLQLNDKLALAVKLPFVEDAIGAPTALLIIAVSLTGPMLYLLSLLQALPFAISRLDAPEGAELMLFHPTVLGPVIGFAWMSLPAAVAVAGWATSTHTGWWHRALAALLICSSCLCSYYGGVARRAYLRRFPV